MCFLRVKKHIRAPATSRFLLGRLFSDQHLSENPALQCDWCVHRRLLSCRVQKLQRSFSTGVCGSRCRRAGSCKLLISLRTHDSPSQIESAYTCNHMLQPSDRSIPLPTDKDKLSPSAVPPCTLNVVFRYTWTHFT